MDILNALQWRYAVQQFSNEILDDAEVTSLLEATRLSASSFGLQPYRILLVTSQALKQQLLEHSYGQDKVVNNSHLLVFAAQTSTAASLVNDYVARVSETRQIPISDLAGMEKAFKSTLGYKTPEQLLEWAHHQVNIALGNLLTCAAIMKIDTCPMGGFIPEAYDDVLGLKAQGLTASVVCALGKRHEADEVATMPKVRVPYADMIIEL